ncbi:3-oxoacyl-ACP synthase III family protein [Phytohabitans houttuyneae]|uniref:3-oxoacyl-[acyl-carrier-protein] synthase 3 n=1 Tax=Phytohabitans houttuyneae TaxID=1076126 RepID=A0A6V8JYP9_9ACTN|nr:ketoacyl-ACP synthase III [Phytohabitans houttuyneae]GFJ76420.1 3-oxoacyl-[acyl-carrier-protein] synthase 3 [Phytohabitans houttuyneae]
MTAATILGTGSALPARLVGNAEVGAPAGVDAAWVVAKTGIRYRRWAAPGELTSDLAVAAARRALRSAGRRPEQVGVIVVATSTPDQPQPPTAAAVQHRLGARDAAAFDVNAVCSGFVFALATAHGMVAGDRCALVIGADVYSRILDPTDRRSAILFGDGAGAAVLGPARDGGDTALRLHTFGAHRDLIRVPPGGHFTMDGRAVRGFVRDRVPDLVHRFLADRSVPRDAVAHLVPHQANGVMLDELGAALDLPAATVHRTVETYGNTGAASVPVTLDHAARAGRIRAGERVLLLGFGGGMAVGMALLTWSPA